MQEERPIRPEESAALTDRLWQAFTADEQTLTVHFADQAFHLQRVARGEYTMERAGVAITARVLLGLAAMPADYPSDLPYLPGEIVMLSGFEPHMSATWWSRNDPERLLALIERQSLESGWTRDADVPMPSLASTHRTYRKANMLRQAMAGQGIVGVFQRPTS